MLAISVTSHLIRVVEMEWSNVYKQFLTQLQKLVASGRDDGGKVAEK